MCFIVILSQVKYIYTVLFTI